MTAYNEFEFQLNKIRALNTEDAWQFTDLARGELYVAAFRTITIMDSRLGNQKIENVEHERIASSKGAGYLSQMPLPNGNDYALLAIHPNEDNGGGELIEIISRGDSEILYAGSFGRGNTATAEIYNAMHKVSSDPESLQEVVKYTEALIEEAGKNRLSSRPGNRRDRYNI